MTLTDGIPKSKFDSGALSRAKAIGFPGLNPIIPDLLEWLQDANWPVAAGTADLLSGAGEAIIEPIRDVLKSSDSIWKYWVIELLIVRLTPSLSAAMHADLDRLATTQDTQDIAEEVHIAARDALAVLAATPSSG